MSSLRALGTLALLAGGIAAGVIGYGLLNPGPPPNPYASLPAAQEPASASAVAKALVGDDARFLARTLQEDVLKQLGQALEPLTDVEDVRFVGAVERSGRVLSGYVARGRDGRGGRSIVGFVLRVQDGYVVGVN